MIISLTVIVLAFLWLGYETNWMRLRLLYEEIIPEVEYEYKTWKELKPWQVTKQYPFWVRYPDLMAPLCGWDYINNTMHIIPQYKIEIVAFGVRNKITLNNGGDAKLLKDIATTTLKATRAQKLAYA